MILCKNQESKYFLGEITNKGRFTLPLPLFYL